VLVHDRLVVRDAGVDDEELESAGALDEIVDGGSHRRLQRNVTDEHVVGAGQLGGDVLEIGHRARGEPDRCAARGERAREGTADSTRRTRDECPRARSDLHGADRNGDPHER
jgi:hypothetical protein